VQLRIRYAFHPEKLEAISAVIMMVADFHEHELESRYVRKMQGLPVWELKTQARGGVKGGTRVYFFVFDNEAIFVNCEVKDGDEPSDGKLKEAAQFYLAHKAGKKLWR
jgi:hypothetical protein